jgi:hypothetical protein
MLPPVLQMDDALWVLTSGLVTECEAATAEGFSMAVDTEKNAGPSPRRPSRDRSAGAASSTARILLAVMVTAVCAGLLVAGWLYARTHSLPGEPVTGTAEPPPGAQATLAPGRVPAPGQVGFRGDPATLKVVDGPSSAPPGTVWNTGALRFGGGDVTLDGVFVKGGVEYSGLGTLSIRNSVIEGNRNVYAPVMGVSGHVDVRDTTIRWQAGDPGPDGWGNGGVHGDARITVIRCDISGTPDGIQTGANGSRIEQNYIHDLAMFGTYPDNSHNDGIQSYGGRNVVIANNRIDIRDKQGKAYDGTHQNAALFFMPSEGWPLVDVQIVGNYLAGGGYTLRLGSPTTGAVVTGNSFGPITGGWSELLIEGAQLARWADNTATDGRPLNP